MSISGDSLLDETLNRSSRRFSWGDSMNFPLCIIQCMSVILFFYFPYSNCLSCNRFRQVYSYFRVLFSEVMEIDFLFWFNTLFHLIYPFKFFFSSSEIKRVLETRYDLLNSAVACCFQFRQQIYIISACSIPFWNVNIFYFTIVL